MSFDGTLFLLVFPPLLIGSCQATPFPPFPLLDLSLDDSPWIRRDVLAVLPHTKVADYVFFFLQPFRRYVTEGMNFPFSSDVRFFSARRFYSYSMFLGSPSLYGVTRHTSTATFSGALVRVGIGPSDDLP